MNAEFWARTEDVLDEALDLLPHERAAFLESACAEMPEIRQEVETLIAAAEDGVELLPALQTTTPGELMPGSELQDGRYRVAARIGRGGIGDVYKAYDRRLACDVALKRLLLRDASSRHAFERDPLLLARLKHPALPTVTDNFIEHGDAFFAMEYVPGRDLSALLKERGRPFEPDTVLAWAVQLLDILEYLHTYRLPEESTPDGRHKPILHRDIKPGNLKLHPAGTLYLLDFGISQSGSLDLTRHAGPSVGLTPHYAPPEQFTPDGVESPRSDLYAWGATMYTLLTGERPPKAETRATVVAEGYDDPLVPPHHVRPTVPVPFSETVFRTMALRPEERPPSAAAVRALLLPADPPIETGAEPSGERDRLPTLLLAGLLLGFLVSLALVFYIMRSDVASEGSAAAAGAADGEPVRRSVQSSVRMTPLPTGDGDRSVVEPPAADLPDLAEAPAAGVGEDIPPDDAGPDDQAVDAVSEARTGPAAASGPSAGVSAPATVSASFAFRDTSDPSALLTRGYIEVDGQPVDGLAGQALAPGERCFRVRRDGYALVGAQVGEALVAGLNGRVCLDVAPGADPLRIVFYMERN